MPMSLAFEVDDFIHNSDQRLFQQSFRTLSTLKNSLFRRATCLSRWFSYEHAMKLASYRDFKAASLFFNQAYVTFLSSRRLSQNRTALSVSVSLFVLKGAIAEPFLVPYSFMTSNELASSFSVSERNARSGSSSWANSTSASAFSWFFFSGVISEAEQREP